MKRLAFFLLVFVWAGAAPGHEAADRHRGRCVAGEPSPSGLPQIRPMASAICHYDTAELHARIDRLLSVREGRLRVEEVERIFSMPRITTTYDRPRSAHYSVTLRAAPGREPWAVGMSVEESYPPDLDSLPPRFRGSGRPVRINPRERGEMRVRMHLGGREDAELVPGQPICVTVTELRDRLVRRGWVVGPTNGFISPHAPRGWQPMWLSHGGLSFFTTSYDGHPCAENIELAQVADPPPPPVVVQPDVSLGYGTCEDWTRARYYESGRPRARNETARRMEQWAWGYLAASQRDRPLSVRKAAAIRDVIWGQLDAWCTAHQPALFGEAVSTVIEQLRRHPPRRR